MLGPLVVTKVMIPHPQLQGPTVYQGPVTAVFYDESFKVTWNIQMGVYNMPGGGKLFRAVRTSKEYTLTSVKTGDSREKTPRQGALLRSTGSVDPGARAVTITRTLMRRGMSSHQEPWESVVEPGTCTKAR